MLAHPPALVVQLGASPGSAGAGGHNSRLEGHGESADSPDMSTVKEIESAITRLSSEEQQAVRDWLEDFLEDQLKVTDEFKAKVERAQREIAEGVYSRTRQPDAGQ